MKTTLLKIVIRGIGKQKGIFCIKILSFAIVFIFAFFTWAWIRSEKQFDQWIPDHQQVYRLTIQDQIEGRNDEFAFIWKEWLKEIPGFFPEIEEMVRLEKAQGNIAIRCKEQMFNTRKLYGADSNVFSVFQVKILNGSLSGILDNPKTGVLSKSMAIKCFGTIDCIGKTIQCSQTWDSAYFDYNITGIMEDFPQQSHLHPEIIVSFDNPDIYSRRSYVYLKLKPGAKPDDILARFNDFKKIHGNLNTNQDIEAHLQPISDIHLLSHKDRELETPGNPMALRIMSVAVLVLIIISIINYINLQLISLSSGQKLFSINKTFGARSNMMVSYLILSTSIVFLTSIIIFLFALNPISNILKNYLNLPLSFDFKNNWLSFLLLSLLIYGFVFLSDFYIVFFTGLSKRKVFRVLQHSSNTGFIQKSRTRSFLLVTQSAFTIILISASIVSVKQLNFMSRYRIGNGTNNIINLKNLPRVAVDNYARFKEELLKEPVIMEVTSSMEEPAGETNDKVGYVIDGLEYPGKRLFLFPTDHNFNSFYNNKIIAGEDISYVSDKKSSVKYVINETAMKELGFTAPEQVIGKSLSLLFPYKDFFYPGYISGVVQDFHLSSMEEKVKPLVLYYLTFFNYSFSIKTHPYAMAQGIKSVAKTWQKIFPDHPFEYFFIDQLYADLYAHYIMQSKFLYLVLIMILIISCTGLIAIVTLQVKRRTKEIGIRKAAGGAKTSELLVLLNKDFIKWVIIAFIISTPIAYYFLYQWLQNFAYQTKLNWWIFGLAGILALVINLLTVSWQSWQAARKNPVEALRYE